MGSVRARILTAVALVTAAPLLAQSPSRDLWVGVLTYDAGYGQVTAASGTVLRPVAALIGATWRSEPDDGVGQLESGPNGSARWPPAGRAVPRAWKGRLTDGRSETFDVSGEPHATGVFDQLGVPARVRPPRPSRDAGADDILGLAVSGRAAIYPFVDVGGPSRGRVSDVMRRAMVEAELKEIAAVTAGAKTPWARMAAEVPVDRLAAGDYEVDVHRVATLPAGSRIVVFEGVKVLSREQGCNSLRSGVSVEQRLAGPPRVHGAWAYLICQELSIRHQPVGIIERDGRSCVVSEHVYEDGVRYVLMPPGEVGDDPPVSNCSIR